MMIMIKNSDTPTCRRSTSAAIRKQRKDGAPHWMAHLSARQDCGINSYRAGQARSCTCGGVWSGPRHPLAPLSGPKPLSRGKITN